MDSLEKVLLLLALIALWIINVILISALITGCGKPHSSFYGSIEPEPVVAEVTAERFVYELPPELDEPLEPGIYAVGAYVDVPGCSVGYGPAGMDTWRIWEQGGQRYLAKVGQPDIVGTVAIASTGEPNEFSHVAHHYSNGCIYKHVTEIRLRKYYPYRFQGEWVQYVEVAEYTGAGGCDLTGAVCQYSMKVAGAGE